MPELTRFESTKSMMRYLPPNGTAGFARSRVNGCSRVPCPPAIISANVLIYARLALGHAPHGDGARTRGKFRAPLEYKQGECPQQSPIARPLSICRIPASTKAAKCPIFRL